ncbi:hypothetical protein J421_4063 [Gemmatirosa kalamazoonensis]|uniref:Uncharacterized protein n=1 Tax=Gemmatirosa kalamazoonensis TaxID=861299 RepID=W0RMP4_9BACT|nr:hypothetical protein J421_4063 [Gemmatirosa kalamazoonensis]
MTSFSRAGTPIFLQLSWYTVSQPAKSTFSCVNASCTFDSGTPRSDVKRNALWVAPASTRPRPSVVARSAKIGPADVDVFTGMPPSKRKVTPPLVEPMGVFATLVPIASTRKPMMEPFCAAEDGTKCVPCAWIVIGLLGSAEPARKSGSSPEPKMNSSAMRSRSPCAASGAGVPTRGTSSSAASVRSSVRERSDIA